MSKGTKKEQGYVKEGAPETVKSKNSQKLMRNLVTLRENNPLSTDLEHLVTSLSRFTLHRASATTKYIYIYIYMYI